MKTSRLEAFSDGVLAIIITIMVLEMKVPHGTDWSSLQDLWPVFVTYVMSFVYLGIYWNNHHHMLHLTETISGRVLWANLHLLFWVSLIPFATGWMGENQFAPLPTALYGAVLLLAGIAWRILQQVLIACQQHNQKLRDAIGRDYKGKISVLLYAVGTGLALVLPALAIAVYVIVALIWIIPDRRFEREMSGE